MVKKSGKRSKTEANKPLAGKKKVMSLREKLEAKLHGGQFRSLNEDLYRNTGAANFARFCREPELMEAYHRGFREQAKKWPRNPVDEVIGLLSKRERLVVADMGCGDAKIFEKCGQKHEVHSFDLVATKKCIVACDVAKTPLKNGTVDFVVFCLALMGPSLWDFLKEAHRILKTGGHLHITEVRSRFDEQHDGLNAFERSLKALGFDKHKPTDATSNTMFATFHYKKTARPIDLKALDSINFSFKVCLYKKR